MTGTVLFTDAAGRQVRAAAGVIPPGVVHAVDAAAATGLMIYLEPTGTAGRRLAAFSDPATCDDARTWSAVAHNLPKVADSQELSESADAVMHQLLGSDPMPSHIQAPHPSVREAIGLLPELLSGQVRLTDVAKAVHLSADRLGRLFARDVGLSFPAYVRWARLIRAMEVARGGGTITDAAHAAGFTDSSHANRAFHEMFGIAPIDAHRSVRLG